MSICPLGTSLALISLRYLHVWLGAGLQLYTANLDIVSGLMRLLGKIPPVKEEGEEEEEGAAKADKNDLGEDGLTPDPVPAISDGQLCIQAGESVRKMKS